MEQKQSFLSLRWLREVNMGSPVMNNIITILTIASILVAVLAADDRSHDKHNNRGSKTRRKNNNKLHRHVAYKTANTSRRNDFRWTGDDETEVLPIEMIEDEKLADYACGMRYSGEERIRRKRFLQEGFDVGLYAYPSFLRLRVTSKKGVSFSCGAVLINRLYALTAAHCVLAGFGAEKTGLRRIDQAWLVSGIHRKNRDEDPAFRVEKHCPLAAAKGDVALLKLDGPVMYSRTLQPVCLSETLIRPSDQATVVGFGGYNQTLAHLGHKQWGPNLQALPVAQVSCPAEGAVGGPELCFEASNSEYQGRACAGDAGGPVYVNFDDRQTLVGIMTRGNKKCYMQRGPGLIRAADVYALKRDILIAMKKC